MFRSAAEPRSPPRRWALAVWRWEARCGAAPSRPLRVLETDPRGMAGAILCPGMGRFTHEAASIDPQRRVVYLTEDESDGCFYRFRPSSWPDLTRGDLEVLCRAGDDQPLTWAPVPDPAAEGEETRYQVPDVVRFDGGEGSWYADGSCWFTTKGDPPRLAL